MEANGVKTEFKAGDRVTFTTPDGGALTGTVHGASTKMAGRWLVRTDDPPEDCSGYCVPESRMSHAPDAPQFKAGDRVEVKDLGPGRVLRVSTFGNDWWEVRLDREVSGTRHWGCSERVMTPSDAPDPGIEPGDTVRHRRSGLGGVVTRLLDRGDGGQAVAIVAGPSGVTAALEGEFEKVTRKPALTEEDLVDWEDTLDIAGRSQPVTLPEEAKPAPRFKPGDRVIDKGRPGETFVVRSQSGPYVECSRPETPSFYASFHESRLSPADTPGPASLTVYVWRYGFQARFEPFPGATHKITAEAPPGSSLVPGAVHGVVLKTPRGCTLSAETVARCCGLGARGESADGLKFLGRQELQT